MLDITEVTHIEDVVASDQNEILPFASVILPVYNDAEALRKCLHSLRAQTYPADRFEVIVVDNGSTKDDPQAVVAEFPGYRYCVEGKVGSYAARNKGISLANGKVYAFIDADCDPSPQWLEEGVRTLLAHPECGLVGGRVDIFAQEPERPTSVELYQRVVALQLKKWIEQWHVCGTCNMFVWPKVFDKVGVFDESFKSGGDFEWSGRVYAAGLKLKYNGKACMRHPARRTWREIIKRQRRIAGGRRYLKFDQNDSNDLMGLFHRAYRVLVPQIRKYSSDDRLKSRSERFRVAMVVLILHYVAVWERLRLMLGFNATRG